MRLWDLFAMQPCNHFCSVAIARHYFVIAVNQVSSYLFFFKAYLLYSIKVCFALLVRNKNWRVTAALHIFLVKNYFIDLTCSVTHRVTKPFVQTSINCLRVWKSPLLQHLFLATCKTLLRLLMLNKK